MNRWSPHRLLVATCLVGVVAAATLGGVAAKNGQKGKATPSAPKAVFTPATAPADSPTDPARSVPRNGDIRIYPVTKIENAASIPTTSSPSIRWSELMGRQAGTTIWAIPSSTNGWSTGWLISDTGAEFDHRLLTRYKTRRFLVRTSDLRVVDELGWTPALDNGPVPIGYHGPVAANYPIKLYRAESYGPEIRESTPVQILTRKWVPYGYPDKPLATATTTDEIIQAGCTFMWVYPSPNPKFMIGHCPLLGGKRYAVERTSLRAVPTNLKAAWCAPSTSAATSWFCASRADQGAPEVSSDYRGFVIGLAGKSLVPSHSRATVPSDRYGSVPPLWPYPDKYISLTGDLKMRADRGNGLAEVQRANGDVFLVPLAALRTTTAVPLCYSQKKKWPCTIDNMNRHRHGRLR